MTDPRHRVAVALAAFALVVMALDARAPTFEEAMAQGTWEEGTVTVRGIVDESHVIDTANGELHSVSLRYAWYDQPFIGLAALGGPGLLGDLAEMGELLVDAPLEEGTPIRMDLHFERFMLDGTQTIAPREALCVHPCLHLVMADVIDAVSRVQGLELQLVSSGEWATYEASGDDEQSVPIANVLGRMVSVSRDEPISLEPTNGGIRGLSAAGDAHAEPPIDSVNDWVVLSAVDFVTISDLTGPDDAAGQPEPLHSMTDWLSLEDVNSDGRFGAGDRLHIRYPAVQGLDQATYVLQLFRCAQMEDASCGVATKMALVSADGAYEWTLRADELVTAP